LLANVIASRDASRMGKAWVTIASALCGFMCGSSFSERADAEPVKDPWRSGLSLVLMAGNADGLAVGGQADLGRVAARASFGYFPLLLSLTDPVASQQADPPRYEFFHTYQANADAMLFPVAASPTSRLGLDLGYRYNSELGHGVAFGGQGEFDLWPSASVLAMIMFSVFPDGPERMRAKLGEPDKELNFPFGAGLMGGLGLGLKL
jgi:hypothetical protein